LSLALFALGGADPAGEFCLGTLSFNRPTTIVGPILDIVVISLVAVGMMCEELRRHVDLGLLCLFTVPCKGPLLCLLGCDTIGL
jgi:hypothetical protein